MYPFFSLCDKINYIRGWNPFDHSAPRRLLIHESKYDEVLAKLKTAYASIMKRIGDPLDDGTLYGPLHSKVGVANYLKTLEDAKAAGGVIEFGGKVIEREGNYVEPTIITGLPHDAEVVHRYTIPV